MTSSSAAVLYCQSTFDGANPNDQQKQHMIAAANSINQSGFTTVNLGQWHVHEDGSVYYNDTPVADVMDNLKMALPLLTASGGSVRNVLISFGPFYSDFDAMANHQAAVQGVISSLQALGANGVDWDLEEQYPASQIDNLTTMTNWAVGQGLLVTAAPYTSQTEFWNPLLQATNGSGQTGFSWWNLQLYGGADYGSWVQGLGSLVPDPQGFLVPGWNIGNDPSPSDLETNVSGLARTYPGLSGGFIWRYEDANTNGQPISAYAQAILSGLGAEKPKP